MGQALAQAALDLGHKVVVLSGPVDIEYPSRARVVSVVSTEEMLAAAQTEFPSCQGLIGAAAPCDYRPVRVSNQKISKTGRPLRLELIETPDIVAELGKQKEDRWIVGFALETDDHHLRAMAKLERKCCDLVVVNGPEAMHSLDNRVEILSPSGEVVAQVEGPKKLVAEGILRIIQRQLIHVQR